MPYHYADSHKLADTIRDLEAAGETITAVVPQTTVTKHAVAFHIFTSAGSPPLSVRPSMAPNVYREGGAA